MKRKVGYILAIMIFGLVFASQITHVRALTRYNDYDSYDDGYLVMDCQASIWASPKAGGGYYMNHQYFNVESESGCGIIMVIIVLTIQENVVFNQIVVGDLFGDPVWGPNSNVYCNNWDYYEYETSNYAVWAEIAVYVYWTPSGGPPETTVINAEASFGS